MLPPVDLSDDVKEQMTEITRKIAIATKTVGLINIQFAVKNETAYVIEANRELKAQEEGLTKDVIKKIQTIIEGVAKRKGYDLVLDNNERVVLYSPDSMNITSEVLKKLKS